MVNSMYFSEETVKSGEFAAVLKSLMDMAYGKGDYYNDIRIHPADCGAFTIEWVQIPWSHEFGGEFKYIEDNQKIFTEYSMPDNTYVYFETEEEYEEYLKENFNNTDRIEVDE